MGVARRAAAPAPAPVGSPRCGACGMDRGAGRGRRVRLARLAPSCEQDVAPGPHGGPRALRGNPHPERAGEGISDALQPAALPPASTNTYSPRPCVWLHCSAICTLWFHTPLQYHCRVNGKVARPAQDCLDGTVPHPPAYTECTINILSSFATEACARPPQRHPFPAHLHIHSAPRRMSTRHWN